MSEIEKLIQELCPNGVPFKKLGEICKINRGTRVVRNELEASGKIPVYQNSLTPLGYYNKANYSSGTTFVISAGAAGQVGFSNIPFWAADDCLGIETTGLLLNRYVYFNLLNKQSFLTSQVRKASVPRLSRKVIEHFEIPVPPVAVQEKIVEILDNFTSLTAELEAELEARKRQYEYYRNLLLSFNPVANGAVTGGDQQIGDVSTPPNKSLNIRYLSLGEMGTFYSGLTGKNKSDFSNGNAKLITYMNVFSNISLNTDVEDKVKIKDGEKQNTIKFGDVIFTGSSETPEESGMTSVLTKQTDEDLYLNSFCFGFRLHDNNMYDPEFLKHLLRSQSVRNQIIRTANGVTRFNVSKKLLQKVVLPIPPIEEQYRIANILNSFEALVNDLSKGLPAEIETRRKQYEYYRNKLLTFKKIA